MQQQGVAWSGHPIGSWAQFHRVVKRPGRPLLARLDDYDDSLLVAGCQRSGTTALTRLLKRSGQIANFTIGHDDELDGALLLAGHLARLDPARHCFQTTYLNDRYTEYFDHDDYRLIWIIREPGSVVYSMLHNWKHGALNRLFGACGHLQANGDGGWLGPSRLDKACACYAAKTEQTHELVERLGPRMLVVDYDELIVHKRELLPRICEFAGLRFDPSMLDLLHDRSVSKGRMLSRREAGRVDEVCRPFYERARPLRSIECAHG